MFKTTKGKYKCLYCGKSYSEEGEAVDCKDSHHLVYVPIAREDLNRLLQFVFLKQDDLLTPELVRILQRYNQHQAVRRY